MEIIKKTIDGTLQESKIAQVSIVSLKTYMVRKFEK